MMFEQLTARSWPPSGSRWRAWARMEIPVEPKNATWLKSRVAMPPSAAAAATAWSTCARNASAVAMSTSSMVIR
jgi:hypothetical protein